MSISLEQIDMLKQRANVSYQEAKEVLEKCNNDVVEALIYLEKEAKVKTTKWEGSEAGDSSTTKKVVSVAKRLYKKGNETRFVVSKNDKNVVDLSANIVILAAIAATPVTVVGVLGALATKHKIRFTKSDGGDLGINKTLDKFSSAVDKVSSQVSDAVNKS